MVKYQNYKNYKLPITVEPLKYGKLIIHIEQLNLFIVSITPKTLAIITKNEDFNHIKFFRDGNFIFEYKDTIITDNTFRRSLGGTLFNFINNELVSIENLKSIILELINKFLLEDIYKNKTILFLIISFYIIFPENSLELTMLGSVIKLRKVASKYK
jgi:hypothetical protein